MNDGVGNFKKAADDIARIMQAGEQIYRDLLSVRPDDTDMIICPEHLGDTIWIAVYAEAYIKKHDCSYVYYVVKESQKEMVEHFPGIAGTVSLTSKEMLALRIYIVAMQLWSENHIVYGHGREVLSYGSDSFYLRRDSESHMESMVVSRCRWLGIDEDSVPGRMIIPNEGNDPGLTELFGNSVLFVPTAQSARSIPDSFWINLANRYREQGYDVYTNYNGFDYEQKIDGIKPIASSILELAQISQYFSKVITLRSGASDLLMEADSDLVVLYNCEVPDKGIMIKPGDVVWDSINDLVDRKGVEYYQYLPDRSDELLDVLAKGGER